MMSVFDRDTHEKLTSPRQFPKLYDKVTHLHKDYLKALEALGREWVNYHQWTSQCRAMGVKTHQGTSPERLSPTMIYGVFECRGYIEVQKDEKTKLNLYRLTDKGKGYLEALLEIPAKCRGLRVAKWLPWWCRWVCTKTGTKLCYWLCKPLGKAR